jgi:hypothetical protein
MAPGMHVKPLHERPRHHRVSPALVAEPRRFLRQDNELAATQQSNGHASTVTQYSRTM